MNLRALCLAARTALTITVILQESIKIKSKTAEFFLFEIGINQEDEVDA